TEPGAGSDAKATKVTAVRDGDSFVVNGTKIYCTNGSHAGVIVFTARTDPKSTDVESINAFVVEKGTPGLTYGKLEDKLGLRGSLEPRPGPPVRDAGLLREALRLGDRHARLRQRCPGARRHRLHPRLPRGAHAPRREALRDRRGHQRDPAPDHRPPPRPRRR